MKLCSRLGRPVEYKNLLLKTKKEKKDKSEIQIMLDGQNKKGEGGIEVTAYKDI